MRALPVIALAVLSLVAGCSTPALPPELIYSPPEPGDIAHIRGSEENAPVPILDKKTAYVFAVNGKRASQERKGWNSDLPIPAGTVVIAAAFEQGAYFAVAEFELNATAGQRFEVRAQTDGKYERQYIELWIIDQTTGKAVTPAARVSVRSSGTTFIPIVVP